MQDYSDLLLNSRFEVPCIARAQLVALEQDKHVSDLEILVPARLAADLCAQAHISLEQRRHFGDHVARHIQRRQRGFRFGAQVFGAQVAFAQSLSTSANSPQSTAMVAPLR